MTTTFQDRGYERTTPKFIEITSANQSAFKGLVSVKTSEGEAFKLPAALHPDKGARIDQSAAFRAMRDARKAEANLMKEREATKTQAASKGR